MLKTILLGIYLIVPVLLFSILVFPYLLIVWLKLGKWADPYVKSLGAAYSRHLLWLGGGRVTVRGLENIPARKDICFISNHQSYVDIPLIVGYIPRLTGFVAKSELFKVPFLRIWLKALGCVKLNRGSGRSAIAMISEGSKSIRDGHPLVMFPEGTRSKSPNMGPFKPGSLKIATRYGAVIVPLTVNGTFHMLEEYNRVRSAKIDLIVHPPIDTGKLSKEELETLPEVLREIIAGPFRNGLITAE